MISIVNKAHAAEKELANAKYIATLKKQIQILEQIKSLQEEMIAIKNERIAVTDKAVEQISSLYSRAMDVINSNK